MATSFFSVLHELRRTYSVHALTSGIPLPRLQRLLGHRTPAMTPGSRRARPWRPTAKYRRCRSSSKLLRHSAHTFAHSALEVRTTLVLTCCPAIPGAVAKW
jgi:hypothetical protein